MKKNMTIFGLGIVSSIFFGCAVSPKIHTQIDSISSGDIKTGEKVFVTSGTQDTALLTNEFRGYVEVAVRQSGFDVVESPKDSDFVVIFNYGMSSDIHTEFKPVYSRVAPKTYKFEATSTVGYVNRVNTSGTVKETGPDQYVQTGVSVENTELFIRGLVLTALRTKDYLALQKDSKFKPQELWQTRVTSKGRSGNLREVFPILVAAARPYLASDTKGNVTVVIDIKDKAVESMYLFNQRTPASVR